jgi:DnaK suppressor protein
MDARTLTYFKRVLTKELEHLQRQETETKKALLESHQVFADLIDQASSESQTNFKLRIRSREKMLIQKLQHALERIENGTFGICDECGEEIPIKRLKARPVTIHCIACKSSLEAHERALESSRSQFADLVGAG